MVCLLDRDDGHTCTAHSIYTAEQVTVVPCKYSLPHSGLLSAYAYHPRLQEIIMSLLHLYELNCEVAYCTCAGLPTDNNN